MSINSTHNENHSVLDNEPRLVNLRFSLRRLLSKTALADIYWSNDLHGAAEGMPEKNVLLLVNPAITRLTGFPHAWQQVLSRPAPPATAYPDVVAFGEDKGDYWLVLNNISGMLLSERINELDNRGLPLDIALDTLDNISQTLSSIQAGAFGHIEPGAIQQTDRGYKILNAPLVKVLQQIVASERSTINKLALHSSYLSPSVAVGDIPVTEDDSFSVASLLYTFLAGKSPFGEQSTLTAVAHGDAPLPLKQLKKTSWETLQQALSYQRSARPENPEKLLAMLKKSNKRRIAFPLAVLAAAGVTVFAGQHLVNRLGDFIQPGNQMDQQAEKSQDAKKSPLISQTNNNTPPSIQTEATNSEKPVVDSVAKMDNADKKAESIAAIELVNEPELGADNTSETIGQAKAPATTSEEDTAAETVATTQTEQNPDAVNTVSADEQLAQTSPSPEPSAETTDLTDTVASAEEPSTNTRETTDQLLKQAVAALNDGQINDAEGKQGVLSLLRETLRLDEDNVDANALLGKVVEKKYQAAEQQINKNEFTAAETLLSESDTLIREFMLTEKLQRQVKLESKITILRQEQEQIGELLTSAREAIQRGDISKDDSSSANALAYLSRVMFKQPGNKDGQKLIDEIVGLRQQATRNALDNSEMEQAGTYLGESERLIRKYKLTQRRGDQQTLEWDYQSSMAQPQAVAVEQINDNVEVITLNPEASSSKQIVLPNNNSASENQAALQTRLPEIPTVLPEAELPVEKLAPNSIGIQVQASRIEEITDNSELLKPEQIFIPEAIPGAASAQAVPIWEADNLQQIQQNTQPNQAVVVYAPTTNQQQNSQQPVINNPAPVTPEINQAVVSFTPENQVNTQVVQPQELQPLPAINNDQTIAVFQPDPSLAPSNNTAITAADQLQQLPIIEDFLPPVTEADQQAMANVQAPLGEIIPELQELPVSAIEEILPSQ